MKLKFTLLLLIFAHSYVQARPCHTVDSNSCWQAINHSSQWAQVVCESRNAGSFEKSLNSGQQDSEQFDSGFGDGLGYPQPRTLYSCDAKLAHEKTVHFEFQTLDWGDQVQILISDRGVLTTLKSSWNAHIQKIQANF